MTRAVAFIAALLALGLPAQTIAVAPVDVEHELKLLGKGVTPPKRFGEASFRVAVFSYEDPDGLDLGDALAALVGHEILADALVSSIGMLRYVGRLTPQLRDELSYFDKVELLSRSQEPTVAIWGMVRRDGEALLVDTWLQIPADTVVRGLQIRLTLPGEMAHRPLKARLGGDRLLVQRHRLPLSAVGEIRKAVNMLEELRAQPRIDVPGVRMPARTVYSVKERRGDWVQIRAGNVSGWVPIRGHCTGDCARLLEAPHFVSELLRFMERRIPPSAPESLADDARLLRDEIVAVQAYDREPPQPEIAARMLAPWLPGTADAAKTAVSGAGAANVRLVGEMKAAIWKARNETGRAPPRETVRALAFQAAEAAVLDPRNLDLLYNLKVLYEIVRDDERAALARHLLEEASTASRVRQLPDHDY